MPVTFASELRDARFVERPNRFVVVADVDGERVRAHCPNPGRLSEFLHEGTPFLVRQRPDATPDQATQWSVVAAMDGRFHVDSALELGQAPPARERSYEDGAWVILDTQKANTVVADAIENARLDDVFGSIEDYRTEPAAREGRFDFQIEAAGATWMVEVKSVTLVGDDGETALFPDAPTERGTRHVRELTERAREGEPAAVLFLAMREDARRVVPNAATDPDFATALADARQAGVNLVGYRTRLEDDRLELAHPIPVELEGHAPNDRVSADPRRREAK